MAKPSTPPGLEPVNYQVLQQTDTFSGSDVEALIIYPDDEERLRFVAEYLGEINEVISRGDDAVTLGDVQDEALSNLLGRAGTADFLNLVNLQSITISTFRSKSQVRALGQVNPRGIARGSRTIGGTMILTEFNRDVFYKLVRNNAPMNDSNIGDVGQAVLPDQVAPFDMVMLLQHEFGSIAYRYIYGIELVTNGLVYSIQDMYHENTVSFLCRDVTPLTPVTGNVKEQLETAHKLGAAFGPNAVQTARIASLASINNGREIVRRFRQQKNARDPFK